MPNQVILVTGMSGAGKSTALKTLEDIGFEAIDNIPLSILFLLIDNKVKVKKSLAIGIDIRNRDYDTDLFVKEVLPLLSNFSSKILFLDANDDVLLRRFTETRRKHPISDDMPVIDAISLEKQIIEPLHEYSDLVLDTSDFSLSDLRKWIKNNFSIKSRQNFHINIISFSYKKGIPRDADLVFDVRFLKNPHYVDALRSLTGKSAKVKKYIEKDKAFNMFFKKLSEILLLTLPLYKEEGKSYLTLAIGCTGGRHRSVFTAEKISALLKAKKFKSSITHRDL